MSTPGKNLSPISGSEVDDVIWLLDTHLIGGHGPISCIAAALREARQIVGRNPRSGMVEDPSKGDSWAGALMYLVYCEQVGSCFQLVGKSQPKADDLRRALIQFAGFDDSEARSLVALRNRLAHDFTIVSPQNAGGYGTSFALTGSAKEPVVSPSGATVIVGLPALAHRVETTFSLNLLLALDEDRLACRHRGGVQGVLSRFRFQVLQ